MDQGFQEGRTSAVRARHAVASLPVPQRLDLDPVACGEQRAGEAEAFTQAADIDGVGGISPCRDDAGRGEIICQGRGAFDGRRRDEHSAFHDRPLDRPPGAPQAQAARAAPAKLRRVAVALRVALGQAARGATGG